jgi:hypothetical protein
MGFADLRLRWNFERLPVDDGGKVTERQVESTQKENLFHVEHFWYWPAIESDCSTWNNRFGLAETERWRAPSQIVPRGTI